MKTIICEQCNDKIPVGSEWTTNNGDVLCSDCYNERYICCDACSDEISLDNHYQYNDESYCESCYSDKFFSCASCSEVYLRDDEICSNITNESYCNSCYCEIFNTCEYCGSEIYVDDAYFSEETCETLCEDCYSNRGPQDGLHSYDYKPEYQYYRSEAESKNNEHTRNLYYGIELEVENKDNFDVESITNDLPDFVYAKADSSINNGFEIVSHPCTYKWLRENPEQWQKILDLRKKGFRSYNTETCGMHVHLSKNYFSSLHLYKFLSLFYKPDNAEFILKISRRVPHNFAHWCGLNDDGTSLTYKAKNKSGNVGRYAAVNLQNRCTIEIRIFRGTLNPRSFWKNIEFLQAVVDFTKDAPLCEIDKEHFLTFVYGHKRKYVNLYNWLWDKKFYEDSLTE